MSIHSEDNEELTEAEKMQEREEKLLEVYSDEVSSMIDSWLEASGNDAALSELRPMMQQKLKKFENQINRYKTSGYPLAASVCLPHESTLLFFRGMVAWGDDNQKESLKLIDKSIEMWDTKAKRFQRARILKYYKRNKEAIVELDHIMANHSDEETFMKARQLKDELETLPKSGCFIATAAYNSDCAPQVMTLRRYRDEVLIKSTAGSLFVETYYLISPPVARIIAKSSLLRAATRKVVIMPLVNFVERAHSQD